MELNLSRHAPPKEKLDSRNLQFLECCRIHLYPSWTVLRIGFSAWSAALRAAGRSCALGRARRASSQSTATHAW